MHAEAAIAALKAGKHVFVEKPMALTAADATRWSKRPRRPASKLLVGHVLPLLPEYAFARKAIASGKYGKLLGGHFKRVISDPLWLKDFFDPAKVGGPLVDLHVHDAHLIRLLFGMPTAVTSQGRMRGEVVEYCVSQFQFADPSLVVSAASGVINQQGRSFTHGFEIHLEKATLYFDFAVAGTAASANHAPDVARRQRQGRPAASCRPATRCWPRSRPRSRKSLARSIAASPPPCSRGELARDAIILCHKQTQAVKSGKTVKIS